MSSVWSEYRPRIIKARQWLAERWLPLLIVGAAAIHLRPIFVRFSGNPRLTIDTAFFQHAG